MTKLFSFTIILILSGSCNSHSTSELRSSGTDSINQKSVIGRPAESLGEGASVIYQDRNGLHWFASGEGVFAYKGKSLTFYGKEDGLCGSRVIGIQEDTLGNLFFDTTSGVSKFDGKQFTTLEVKDPGKGKHTWKLEPDDMWFRMGWDTNGPYRYDGEFLYHLEFPEIERGQDFYKKRGPDSFTPYGIYNLYRDSKGAVWFGTTSLGVCRWDGKTLSWLYEDHLSNTPSGGEFGIRSIIEDRQGAYWFCNTRYRYTILPGTSDKNGTSLLNYTAENGIAKPGATSESDVPYYMSIAEDSAGNLWMVTYADGVWCNTGKELIHYPISNSNKEVLLFSVFIDNQGIIWLGTHNAGAYKFDGGDFVPFEII